MLPLGWEELLHLPHEWMCSRSTGWEERRGLPRGWRARDSEWGGRSWTYHWDGWADIFCSRRSCAKTGARQQATTRDSPAGHPQTDQEKYSAHDEAHPYQNQQSSYAVFEDNDGNEAQQDCQRSRMTVPGRGLPWRRRTG